MPGKFIRRKGDGKYGTLVTKKRGKGKSSGEADYALTSKKSKSVIFIPRFVATAIAKLKEKFGGEYYTEDASSDG